MCQVNPFAGLTALLLVEGGDSPYELSCDELWQDQHPDLREDILHVAEWNVASRQERRNSQNAG
jgi:hypothetical protein